MCALSDPRFQLRQQLHLLRCVVHDADTRRTALKDDIARIHQNGYGTPIASSAKQRHAEVLLLCRSPMPLWIAVRVDQLRAGESDQLVVAVTKDGARGGIRFDDGL